MNILSKLKLPKGPKKKKLYLGIIIVLLLLSFPIWFSIIIISLPLLAGGGLIWLVYKKLQPSKLRAYSITALAILTIIGFGSYASAFGKNTANKKETKPTIAEQTLKPEETNPTEIKEEPKVAGESTQKPTETKSEENKPKYDDLKKVTRVVDGDTIEVDGVGKIRLIGINTPETVDPRIPVQCFGKEASDKTKELLLNKMVYLESDSTQSDKDKYDRYLRYVFLKDGTFFNKLIISEGYAFEYTYETPYKYQLEFKDAQNQAKEQNKGLWANDTCNGELESVKSNTSTNNSSNSSNNKSDCIIKGNISSSKEKIYHMPGQQFYDKTVIDESKGERWFCSESEAQSAGWRKSKK